MPHAEDGDVTGKNEPGILWCILVLFWGGGAVTHSKKILMAVAKYRRFFLLQ